MLARQRQERILREVDRHGGARVSELVNVLGVSDMTIRRDIEALAERDLVLKVHGGATTVTDRSADEPGFQVKSQMSPVQKSAIARATATLISPGDSVAISAGTTTYAVAHELRAMANLAVVTNSPHAPVRTTVRSSRVGSCSRSATARRLVVVADHNKRGVIGLCTIATLDQVDVLVTDADLDTEARRAVAQQVGQLVVATSNDMAPA